MNSQSKPTHLIGAVSRNCFLMARIHFSTLDAQRVSVNLKCIPSAVRWYTRDRGTRVGFIGMRGRERSRLWERLEEKLSVLMDVKMCILYSRAR
jgi:hypothetical protein